MRFDALRRRFGAPPAPADGPDPWSQLREGESWTHGFVLEFAPTATAAQVNDFLDEGRSDVPAARLETDFKGRAIRVALPPQSTVEDHLVWVDLLQATTLFVPPTSA